MEQRRVTAQHQMQDPLFEDLFEYALTGCSDNLQALGSAGEVTAYAYVGTLSSIG